MTFTIISIFVLSLVASYLAGHAAGIRLERGRQVALKRLEGR